MPTEHVHILGAGGHARVVVDALLCSGADPAGIALYDDRAELAGTEILGLRIKAPVIGADIEAGSVHAAIGHNATRARVLRQADAAAERWRIVRHPAATVAASARIGAGSFLAAQSVTGPCAVIGQSVIINHGAVVDHDCHVGDFSHVAPHASLGGGARVGDGVLVGAGAIVLPGVHIGDHAVIGAGAVVLANVAAGTTVAGVPARTISKRKT
jgi:sugar O-acyltransferase (sialic acid O-acetyltransferase NeuD family)